MPAQATLDPALQIRAIVVAAGADPRLARYRDGELFLPDVDQPALDAAIAAHDDAAAFAQRRADQLAGALANFLNAMWEATAFDQENRIRALEGQLPLTRGQFRDLLLTRYRP